MLVATRVPTHVGCANLWHGAAVTMPCSLPLTVLFVDKRRKFDEARKAHYKTGGLAALRAQAAAMDDEDDEDEDDKAESASAAAPSVAASATQTND